MREPDVPGDVVSIGQPEQMCVLVSDLYYDPSAAASGWTGRIQVWLNGQELVPSPESEMLMQFVWSTISIARTCFVELPPYATDATRKGVGPIDSSAFLESRDADGRELPAPLPAVGLPYLLGYGWASSTVWMVDVSASDYEIRWEHPGDQGNGRERVNKAVFWQVMFDAANTLLVWLKDAGYQEWLSRNQDLEPRPSTD